MKILQVCPKYFPSIGGVEEHVKNVSERLARQHDITVFTCDPSGKLCKEEEINGVLVRRFKSFSPGDAYHISFEMAKEFKKTEFDIVHGHNYHAFPSYFSRNAKAGKRVVNPYYHRHGHTPVRNFLIKLYKPLGKKILESADKIIAISHYEEELLLKDFAIEKGKLAVIPPGIHLAEMGDLAGVRKEPKTILYVGRLEEYKGVQHIIQALPVLDKDFHLEIVGKGQHKANLVAQISRLRLNDRVKFYENLPRQELLKMYARAGVFVLLSKHESFSIVVAEALAAGTPCIVADTSALTEWVDDKNCFGICYPVNQGALAELINEVTGKKVADVKIWDWDEVAERIAGQYEDGCK
jgi:glycosyltransferase involved in cell wall biosynthesis